MTSTVSLPSPKSAVLSKEILDWMDVIALLQIYLFFLTPLKFLTFPENYWNV